MKKIKLVLVGCLFLFSACSNLPGQEVKNDNLDNKVKDLVMVNSGLPVEKLLITGDKGRQELEVEIAANDAQRRIGLMNRTSLAERRGMLFVFEKQGYLNFWMKNTLIPLDMIFINENNKIVHIVRNASPCKAARDVDCAKYNSGKPAKYVLEVNGGLAEKLAIEIGNQVSWL
jgi:uncharacterized membrane protein (UPF0127 family)